MEREPQVLPESKASRGELSVKEPHPAAEYAFEYIRKFKTQELFIYQESFASTAIEGNRLAEICSETLDRRMGGKPVSDRYLLGLAWTIRDMEDMKGKVKGKVENPYFVNRHGKWYHFVVGDGKFYIDGKEFVEKGKSNG